MAHWVTALIALESSHVEPSGEPFAAPGRGRVLAHSALLDVGDGAGQLSFLDRGAWEKALAVMSSPGRDVRAFRAWDGVVEAGQGAPVDDWYLSLVVAPGAVALEFDDPTVAGAIRRALAAYLPLLRGRLIATSALMPDWRRCAGALTVFEARSAAEAALLAGEDPWRIVFPGRLFRLERAVFRRVGAPAGPNTQRYGGANPWPGGSFAPAGSASVET
jgi:hypothetical protein